MRKIVIATMMVLLALTSCFAEKYNGFEVRKGYGDVEVIVLKVNNTTFEEPLIYYKTKESQLKIIDKYLNLDETEFRQLKNPDMELFNKAYKNLQTIIDWDEGCLSEKDVELLYNWESDYYDNSEDIEYFYDNEDKLNKSLSIIIGCAQYILMGYPYETIKMLFSENDKQTIKALLEAFPSIKLSSLGL